MKYKKVVENIREHLASYVYANNLKALIVGVSGGIDSALVCALAKPVCNDLDIPLIGISLPIQTNKKQEIIRARKIGERFCTQFFEEHVMENMYEMMAPLMRTEDKVALGNIKARLRMIYLYNLAFNKQGMVLSTDNLTEYFLGFWTLHGDVGDYGMIQNLWKTEVYELAKYIANNEVGPKQTKALLDCVKCIPTDGLGITNSDLDQLGAKTYDEVDKILKKYLSQKGFTRNLADSPVIKRFQRTEFKRNNPLNISRDILEM